MEIKKNKSVDHNRKHHLFLAIGFSVSIAITFSLFELRIAYAPEIITPPDDPFSYHIPLIPITTFLEKHEAPKPKPKTKEFIITEDPVVIDTKPFIDKIKREVNTLPDDFFPVDTIVEPPVVTPFLILEEQASFPGGQKAWQRFLNKNFRYPRKAKRMGIQGKVFLSFYVNAEGEISDIKVDRGIGGGCDEEAIRVLKKSPKWNPGLQRGKPVKSPMSLYINFILH